MEAQAVFTWFLEKTYWAGRVNWAWYSSSKKNRRQKPKQQSRFSFIATLLVRMLNIWNKSLIRTGWMLFQEKWSKKQPPVISLRHAPNLRNRLMHSYVPADQKATWLSEPTGTFQCTHWNHCEKMFCRTEIWLVCTQTKLSCPCAEEALHRLFQFLPETSPCTNMPLEQELVHPMARHFGEHYEKNNSLLLLEGVENY